LPCGKQASRPAADDERVINHECDIITIS
jgi:hypothetical protein